MSDQPLKPGKLPPALLRDSFNTHLRLPPDVLVGPAVGEDACALQVGDQVIVAATDPITLTGSDVGAHAVLVNANDVAVMGVAPRWFLANVLLPVGTTEQGFRDLFEAMIRALDDVGASLVGGHTEVTDAVNQCVVVGQMLGVADSSVHADRAGIVKTGGLRPGDVVLQVGAAPVEGAGIAVDAFAAQLDGLGSTLLDEARSAFIAPGICIVEPALHAARLGAVAMHDPTEGGLSAGLYELAEASGTGLTIDSDAVLWLDAGLAVCDRLGANPWGMLASGTLLAGFAPDKAAGAITNLRELGYLVAAIAHATTDAKVCFAGGPVLPRFERDELSRLLAAGLPAGSARDAE